MLHGMDREENAVDIWLTFRVYDMNGKAVDGRTDESMILSRERQGTRDRSR